VLAADEIVMDPNAVLGPVDPQIGDLPAASIVKAVEIKGASHVSDDTLIVADIAQKARVQVGVFVAALLEKHDFPITVAAARSLGLKVSTDMPRGVYELMDLYPQTDGTKPSVWYVPLPHSPSPKESS
jgi:hypothetical protein